MKDFTATPGGQQALYKSIFEVLSFLTLQIFSPQYLFISKTHQGFLYSGQERWFGCFRLELSSSQLSRCVTGFISGISVNEKKEEEEESHFCLAFRPPVCHQLHFSLCSNLIFVFATSEAIKSSRSSSCHLYLRKYIFPCVRKNVRKYNVAERLFVKQ